MPRFSLEVGFATDVGQKRQRNEDAYALFVPYPGEPNPSDLDGLLLVADGMGGERAGDRASQLAAERLRHWVASGEYRDWPETAGDDGLSDALGRAVRDVSAEIFRLGEEDPTIRGLGSTVVLAAFTEGRVTVVNVGDSRCYRVRGDSIERLSVDHSWVERQVEAGVLTPEEAREHPQRNVLTRSLGDAFDPEPDVRAEPLRHGDLFILCSDGLTGGVNDAEILAMAGRHESPQALADALVARANEVDGTDNITAVVGRCLEEEGDTLELLPEDLEGERDTLPEGTVSMASLAARAGGAVPDDDTLPDPTPPDHPARTAPTPEPSSGAVAAVPPTSVSSGGSSSGTRWLGTVLLVLAALLIGGLGGYLAMRTQAARLFDQAQDHLRGQRYPEARASFDRLLGLVLAEDQIRRLRDDLVELDDTLPRGPGASVERPPAPDPVVPQAATLGETDDPPPEETGPVESVPEADVTPPAPAEGSPDDPAEDGP